MSIKENEYIIIKKTDKTARVIEIYSAPEENDKVLLIYYPNGDKSYVFNSQIIPLSQKKILR